MADGQDRRRSDRATRRAARGRPHRRVEPLIRRLSSNDRTPRSGPSPGASRRRSQRRSSGRSRASTARRRAGRRRSSNQSTPPITSVPSSEPAPDRVAHALGAARQLEVAGRRRRDPGHHRDVAGLEQSEDHDQVAEPAASGIDRGDEREHLDLAGGRRAVVGDAVHEVVLREQWIDGAGRTREREPAPLVEVPHRAPERTLRARFERLPPRLERGSSGLRSPGWRTVRWSEPSLPCSRVVLEDVRVAQVVLLPRRPSHPSSSPRATCSMCSSTPSVFCVALDARRRARASPARRRSRA